MREWHRKAVELFKQGKRPRQIAEELNQSSRQVRRVLSRHGFDLSIRPRQPKYNYDIHFFKHIDTEAKAYFLGLLAADGYMLEGNKNQGFRIKLYLIDREMLVKFGEAIGWTNPTIQKSTGTGWQITVSSHTMFEDLGQLGVVPRKSLILKFCDRVPDDLIRHYIRGYFDGDGCVSWVRTRVGPRLYLTFAGTNEMLTEIESYLHLKLGVKKKRIYTRPNQRIHILQYTSQPEVATIATHFYRNATYFLQRKFNIISSVLKNAE